MLYVIFQTLMNQEDAERAVSRKYVSFPNEEFMVMVQDRRVNLNNDKEFLRILEKVDHCDVPFPNVLRDLYTGDTHAFTEISTGSRMMWLMKEASDRFLFPSCFFGQNCYQTVFDLSKDRDIYVYDDADMMWEEAAEQCRGTFTNYVDGSVLEIVDDMSLFNYMAGKGL